MKKRLRPLQAQESEAQLRNAEFDLVDSMLEKVVEREGAIMSTSQPVIPRHARRKNKITPVPETTTPPITEDPILARDLAIVQSLRKEKKQLTKRVGIRYGEHEASEHFVEIGGLAQVMQETVREQEGTSIQAWSAPYEQPLSIADLAAENADLHIDEIDPRLFVNQFTAADPRIAFAERYGIWAKLCAPFIRWEIQHEGDRLAAAETKSRARAKNKVVLQPLLAKLEESVEHLVEEAKDYEQEVITQVERAWQVPALVPKLDIAKALMGFVVLMLVVSLPAGAVSLSRSVQASQDQVRATSEQAIEHVKAALQSTDNHALEWQKAGLAFSTAQEELSQTNALALALANALPNTRRVYVSAQSLLTAGAKASQAGEALTQGFQKAVQDPGRAMGERIQVFSGYLDAATPLIDDAMTALGQVDASVLPNDIRGKVQTLQTSLEGSRASIREFRSLATWLESVLGKNETRTYLVIFQNQTELRPTGGFMGSLAEITVDRGEIKSIHVPGGGPYDLQGQLLARVQPPKPLQLISDRWEFQDANWFPDFPTAAKKIQWFWSKAGQPTIDGVITINASFMQKLLQITGPIDMPDYGKTITADNFLLETQKSVELEYNKTENKPKKFIGDLMPKVMERLGKASREDWLNLISIGTDSLSSKEIQLYLTRDDEEAMVDRLGWSGKLVSSPADNLALIEANIAGQKTDGVIDETVNHQVDIQSDGSIIETVTLKREHKGEKGELFRGVNNVSYLRVYVPEGSELLAAQGFDPPADDLFNKPLSTDPIDEDLQSVEQHPRPGTNGVQIDDEFGRTVFGGWMQIAPGQTRETSFKYRLPFTVYDIASKVKATSSDPAQTAAAYLVLYNNQSGKTNRTIETHLTWPDHLQVQWSNHPDASTVTQVSDRDLVHAVLFQTKTNPTP